MSRRNLTEGSIARNLIYMSLPAMIGMMAQTMYSLVDMIWLGRLSAEAVASVTIFSSVYFLVFVLNNIIGQGSVPVISQSYGSGDMKRTLRAIETTFTFKLLVGIVASIVLLLIMKPIMGLFTKEAVVLAGAVGYGRIRTLFLPIVFSSITVNTALRCCGDSQNPMRIMIFASVLNIILDPLFMFDVVPIIGINGLGLGINGVAYATVISNVFSFILGFYILFGPKSNLKVEWRGLFEIDYGLIKKIVSAGTPPALGGLFRNLANMVLLGFITSYGTVALAAWGILGRIFGFLFMPINGLMNGGSAMTGQNIGSGKIERAVKTAYMAAKVGTVAMFVLSITTWLFAPQIMKLFIDDPAVIALGAPGLKIVVLSLLPVGFYFGLGTIFTGSGYTIPFLVSGLVGQWLCQIPFLFFVTRVFHSSFIWIPASFWAYTIGEGGILLYYFYSNKWRKKLPDEVVIPEDTA